MAGPESPKPLSERAEKVLEILQTHQREHPGEPVPLTLEQIGTEVGFTRERARQIYKLLSQEHDLPPLASKARQAANQEKYEKIKYLSEQNASFIEIGNRLELSAKQLSADLQRLSRKGQISQIPNYQEDLAERREVLEHEIAHLRRRGKSFKEIKQFTGATKNSISNIVTTLYERGEVPRFRAKRRTKKELTVFDRKVKKLRRSGLTYEQIAEQLDSGIFSVMSSMKRLLDRGAVERGRRKNFELDQKIKRLRIQGLGNVQIAKRLHVPLTHVEHSASRLLKMGEIESLSTNKTTDERKVFDRKVLQLRKNGLLMKEIVQQLGCSKGRVEKSMQRLYKADKLEETAHRMRSAEIRQFDADVLKLRLSGLTYRKIGQRLSSTPKRVERSVARLRKTGRIE